MLLLLLQSLSNELLQQDKQYFNCAPQHGLFVRPQNIVQALACACELCSALIQYTTERTIDAACQDARRSEHACTFNQLPGRCLLHAVLFKPVAGNRCEWTDFAPEEEFGIRRKLTFS